jgi:hypothetical protein
MWTARKVDIVFVYLFSYNHKFCTYVASVGHFNFHAKPLWAIGRGNNAQPSGTWTTSRNRPFPFFIITYCRVRTKMKFSHSLSIRPWISQSYCRLSRDEGTKHYIEDEDVRVSVIIRVNPGAVKNVFSLSLLRCRASSHKISSLLSSRTLQFFSRHYSSLWSWWRCRGTYAILFERRDSLIGPSLCYVYAIQWTARVGRRYAAVI